MSAVTDEVFRKLGASLPFGTNLPSQLELARAVSGRLPLSALDALSEAGFSDKEINDFIIPMRTRSHRASRRQNLTTEESDRAVRLLRILVIAEDTFDDESKARAWLRRPLMSLNNRTPLETAQTEVGARVVEEILAAITYGAPA